MAGISGQPTEPARIPEHVDTDELLGRTEEGRGVRMESSPCSLN